MPHAWLRFGCTFSKIIRSEIRCRRNLLIVVNFSYLIVVCHEWFVTNCKKRISNIPDAEETEREEWLDHCIYSKAFNHEDHYTWRPTFSIETDALLPVRKETMSQDGRNFLSMVYAQRRHATGYLTGIDINIICFRSDLHTRASFSMNCQSCDCLHKLLPTELNSESDAKPRHAN